MALGKNIIQLQEELTYMPMQKLVQLVGDPNSEYGSLPLMEIKNRQELQNASAQAPQSTVADDIISTATTPVGISPPGQTQIADGGISNIPMAMAGGGTVRYNEGGGITVQDVREMLGMPREGFDQRENYPPYYDDDGNIIGYDTRTELGKKLGPKFNYEPPIQNKSEGGSIYNNPYFGNADPEEVKKLQEQNPNLSTEDAVAMILGIDTADITTRQNYNEGGIAELFRSNKVDEEELLDLIRNFPEEYKRLKEGEFSSGIGRAFQDMNYVPRIFGIEPTADKYRKKIIKKIDPVRMLDKEYGRGGDFFDSGSLENFEFFSGLSSDDFDKLQRQKELLKNIDRESLRSEGIKALGEGDTSFIEGLLDPTMGEEGLKSLSPAGIEETENKELQDLITKKTTEEEKTRMELLREQLGLQSAEDAEKQKQAMLLLGLGSAIGGAKNVNEITQGIPSVGKELMNLEDKRAKENLALYTALSKNSGQDVFNKDTVALKNISQVIKEMDESGEQGTPRYLKAIELRDALLRKLDLQGYLAGSQPISDQLVGTFDSAKIPEEA